jgi:UDP-N-acetylglucosamine acyltransferase
MPIHPLAVVDPQAEIDPAATIGPFCCVKGKVTIAAGAELRNHATVYGRTSIGSGTILFPSCVVGSDPQDLKYRGEDSEVIIGNNCRIHEFVTISKGTAGGGMKTVLGNDCLIMAYAHIAHDCRLADRVIVSNNSQLAGHVTVGRKAWIGGMVGIHHFVTIGELAFIGAMSGVRCDVPPYVVAEGQPAEPRNINIVGLKRDGMADQDMRALKDAYRTLFHDRANKPIAEVLARVRSELPADKEHPVCRLVGWLNDHLESSIKGRVQEAARVVAVNGNGHGNGHVNEAVEPAAKRVAKPQRKSTAV